MTQGSRWESRLLNMCEGQHQQTNNPHEPNKRRKGEEAQKHHVRLTIMSSMGGNVAEVRGGGNVAVVEGGRW